MTIWNAFAAGGALWCFVLIVDTVWNADGNDPLWFVLLVAGVLAMGFGLCLWGATP